MRGPAIWPGVVFLLQSGPRTVPEMARLLGTKFDSVSAALSKLASEGLVERTGRRGSNQAVIWRWVYPEQERKAA